MKKAEILRGYGAFKRVFAEGSRGTSKLLRYHWVVGDSREIPLRVGFVVPKHAGSAVWRNRAKRMMKEAVRMHSSSLEETLRAHQMSATVVFVLKSVEDARRIPFSLIASDIAGALRSITVKL